MQGLFFVLCNTDSRGYCALDRNQVPMLLNDVHYINCDVTRMMRVTGMDNRPAPMAIDLYPTGLFDIAAPLL